MSLPLRQQLENLQDEVRLLRESQRSSEEELRGLKNSTGPISLSLGHLP